MREFETEKIGDALVCVSRMAEGKHPADGTLVENEILDNPYVVRSLHCVENVLREILRDGGGAGRDAVIVGNADPGIRAERERNHMTERSNTAAAGDEAGGNNTAAAGDEAGGNNPAAAGDEAGGNNAAEAGSVTGGGGPARIKKAPFPFALLPEFRYTEDKSVTHVLRQFAALSDAEAVRIPGGAKINKWFGANGYLKKEAFEPDGKEFWVPTEKGCELGLYTREGMIRGNRILSVMYNENAQYFLAENLEMILAGERAEAE